MISPIMACYQHVLPIDFDDSISDYEALCKAYRKINDIITYLENQSTDFYQYVDTKVSDLRNELNTRFENLYNQVQKDLEDNKNYVNSEISNMINYVNKQISEMQIKLAQSVAELYQALSNSEYRSKVYTDIEIQKLKDAIPELQNVIVLSPITGILEPLDKVLNDMYNVLNVNALTAWEYDGAGLTAQQYDDLHITAWQYDMEGKLYIGQYLQANAMYSPLTGEWLPIKAVIYQLADLHRNDGITANGYDTLGLTAQVYDNKQVTAYNYDFNGKTVLAS